MDEIEIKKKKKHKKEAKVEIYIGMTTTWQQAKAGKDPV